MSDIDIIEVPEHADIGIMIDALIAIYASKRGSGDELIKFLKFEDMIYGDILDYYKQHGVSEEQLLARINKELPKR